MVDSNWIPIAGTALGAVIALAGSMLSGVRNDRSQRRRDRESERLRSYADFALALDSALAGLREVAQTPPDEPGRYDALAAAMRASDLYGVREHLIMSASPHLVLAGEAAFKRLINMRTAIRSGVVLSSREYHDVYHPYAEALWAFRVAVRVERGQNLLKPSDLDRESWSERERCAVCGPASGTETSQINAIAGSGVSPTDGGRKD